MESRIIFGGEKARVIPKSDSWFKTKLDSMYLEDEYHIAIKLPLPTIDAIIEILITSLYDDEIIAACLFLVNNEAGEETEFRRKLIDKLKATNLRKLDKRQKRRIQTIIILTELNHTENRRDVLGKSIKEVEKDYEDFMQMALEAEAILNKVKPNFFIHVLSKLGISNSA